MAYFACTGSTPAIIAEMLIATLTPTESTGHLAGG